MGIRKLESADDPKPIPLPHLRIVIVDCPKKHLNNESVKKIMSEMWSTRQNSFHRTMETYILMDKHDMLATHFMVYDFGDPFAPKILSGMRLVYNQRCIEHGLRMPLSENIVHAPLATQHFYQKFSEDKPLLPECTGWYVDSNFSYAKTKFDLAQLLFFTVFTHLVRQGIPYCSGASNERYKGSQWVAMAGDFPDGHLFKHPTIPDPHKMTLVEDFNYEWMKKCFSQFGDLIRQSYQVLPEGANLLSFDELEKKIEMEASQQGLKKAS